jgi:DNA polymerase delta subunit 1
MEFMIFNWYSEDRKYMYHIYLFGMNHKGESVCVDITNFTPFFYVKIPSDWDPSDISNYIRNLKEKGGYSIEKGLVDHKVVYKKDAYGFNNFKTFKFIRFEFNSFKSMNSLKWIIKKENGSIYNGNVDPLLTFMHLRNIQASGWVSVKSNQDHELSRCVHNLTVHWKDITPLDIHMTPPLKVLSFDIECYSSSGAFPNPENLKDEIIQIGSGIKRFGTDETKKVVVVLGECDPVDNGHKDSVKIISCKTELELIEKWVDLIVAEDPDLLIGYNIDSFDWLYIWKRQEGHDLIGRLSRLEHVPSDYHETKMESNAYGTNIFNYITTPGINQIDLLHWFRKNTKLDSYKLDFVSEKFLNEKKRPIGHKEIFEMGGPFGTSKSRSVIADYCAQDTVLPIKLMEDRCMLTNLIEMSKVTCVPITWLITRGQQIKVYSQLQKELKKQGFLFPELSDNNKSKEKFIGATVLDPKRGYYDHPVSGLDFKSLYPSIMIAHNLCVTTWVRDQKYNNLPNVEYSRFQWGDGCDYTFVQSSEGIIPGILKRLWGERNKTKKEMKNEKDPKMKAILDGKQLAIKEAMNSIYGVCGSSVGYVPCKPIASTVTFVGRNMINHSKECAEKWYNGSTESNGVIAEILYGDSVTGDMPVTLRIKGGKYIFPKRIDSINTSEWFKYNDEKEQATCDNAMVWSANGWVKIIRVIRHKTKKRLFRVVTRKGIVVVTEDHSLINKENKYVKPVDLKVGDELLHRYIDKKKQIDNTYNIIEEMRRSFYHRFE